MYSAKGSCNTESRVRPAVRAQASSWTWQRQGRAPIEAANSGSSQATAREEASEAARASRRGAPGKASKHRRNSATGSSAPGRHGRAAAAAGQSASLTAHRASSHRALCASPYSACPARGARPDRTPRGRGCREPAASRAVRNQDPAKAGSRGSSSPFGLPSCRRLRANARQPDSSSRARRHLRLVRRTAPQASPSRYARHR
mmetsp:Transcript_99146/g.296291  ORF Transcript_99146/g.296291 Transcript_99146/m.296291 type:complete len:202 (+) Transcript_99146:667-1272(+)